MRAQKRQKRTCPDRRPCCRVTCTLHPTPCTLHPAPCTLHPAPCTLHPTTRTLKEKEAHLLSSASALSGMSAQHTPTSSHACRCRSIQAHTRPRCLDLYESASVLHGPGWIYIHTGTPNVCTRLHHERHAWMQIRRSAPALVGVRAVGYVRTAHADVLLRLRGSCLQRNDIVRVGGRKEPDRQRH